MEKTVVLGKVDQMQTMQGAKVCKREQHTPPKKRVSSGKLKIPLDEPAIKASFVDLPHFIAKFSGHVRGFVSGFVRLCVAVRGMPSF